VNRYLRLVWLAIAGRFRRRVPMVGPCRTPFRVWPTDLDLLMHVNNGIYLTIMDLARIDLMRRAGPWREVLARGWYPVVIAETIQFRRPLTLFQTFEIVTRVLAWDDRVFLLEQRFERRGQTIAIAYVRGRFLSKSGEKVTPAEILALGGLAPDALPPWPVPEAAALWNRAFGIWLGDASDAGDAGTIEEAATDQRAS